MSAVQARLPEAAIEALTRLRELLEAAGYSEAGVVSAPGSDGVLMPRRAELPLWERHSQSRTARHYS